MFWIPTRTRTAGAGGALGAAPGAGGAFGAAAGAAGAAAGCGGPALFGAQAPASSSTTTVTSVPQCMPYLSPLRRPPRELSAGQAANADDPHAQAAPGPGRPES